MYSVVDLFAGCGGISRGFGMTGRFGTDLAVEIEPHFARAFERNITGRDGEPSRMYTGDINKLLDSPIELKEFLDRAELRDPGSLDVLVGGPPCQGFSRNGVRRYEEEGGRFYDQPINHLYRTFLQFLEATMPRVVVIENVREFLKAAGGKFRDDLFAKLAELGYNAEARIVCAADYGVPQLRYRMIVLAARAPYQISFPTPTFGASGIGELALLPPHRTVRDAIGDLPPATPDRNHALPYDDAASVSELGWELRSQSGYVENHFSRKLSAKNLERIRAVGTGRMRDVDSSLRTRSFYGSAYGRLAWDEPSLTITTWAYHVGSGRYAHPVEDRAITMREVARLQSFDDDFVFPPLVNPVSRMIGNAVPPLLAKAIAQEVARSLDRVSVAASDSDQMLAVS